VSLDLYSCKMKTNTSRMNASAKEKQKRTVSAHFRVNRAWASQIPHLVGFFTTFHPNLPPYWWREEGSNRQRSGRGNRFHSPLVKMVYRYLTLLGAFWAPLIAPSSSMWVAVGSMKWYPLCILIYPFFARIASARAAPLDERRSRHVTSSHYAVPRAPQILLLLLGTMDFCATSECRLVECLYDTTKHERDTNYEMHDTILLRNNVSLLDFDDSDSIGSDRSIHERRCTM